MLQNVELLYKLRDAIKDVGAVDVHEGVRYDKAEYQFPVCLLANCHNKGVVEYDLASSIDFAGGFAEYFDCSNSEAGEVIYGYDSNDSEGRTYHKTGADYVVAINHLLTTHGYPLNE